MLGYIAVSFSNIFRNKLRLFLTMFGIIISITVVVSVISIGNTVKKVTGDYFYGKTNGCYYEVSIRDVKGTREEKGITKKEIDDFEAGFTDLEIGYVIKSNYEFVGDAFIDDQKDVSQVKIQGVSYKYSDVRGVKMLNGYFLSKLDCDFNSTAAVISNVTAEKLFGTVEDAIGQTFTVYNEENSMNQFVVKGVYKYKEDVSKDSVICTDIYIPYTCMNIINGDEMANNLINSIAVYINVPMIEKMEAASQYADSYFKNLSLDYKIYRNIDSSAYEVTNVVNYIAYGFTAISIISLIVGGIVLMNTMLVCVVERTKEIGVLQALGAPKHVILFQFMTESFLICTIACVIGIILSCTLLAIMNRSMD